MKRGSVLFEVLLSIALFAGAAMFTIRSVTQGINDLDFRIREAHALDLARTAIAQLEAGLISLADLREGDPDVLLDSASVFDEGFDEVRWAMTAETQPTEYEGLTLLTISVFEESEDAFGFDEAIDSKVVSATLRQLGRLSPLEAQAFEDDELIVGLTNNDEEETP